MIGIYDSDSFKNHRRLPSLSPHGLGEIHIKGRKLEGRGKEGKRTKKLSEKKMQANETAAMLISSAMGFRFARSLISSFLPPSAPTGLDINLSTEYLPSRSCCPRDDISDCGINMHGS